MPGWFNTYNLTCFDTLLLVLFILFISNLLMLISSPSIVLVKHSLFVNVDGAFERGVSLEPNFFNLFSFKFSMSHILTLQVLLWDHLYQHPCVPSAHVSILICAPFCMCSNFYFCLQEIPNSGTRNSAPWLFHSSCDIRHKGVSQFKTKFYQSKHSLISWVKPQSINSTVCSVLTKKLRQDRSSSIKYECHQINSKQKKYSDGHWRLNQA